MAASNPALRAPSPLARPRSNGPSLSKSRFTTGLQCHRLLWWTVNEPDAPELVTSPEQQAIFDQGTAVGEVARAYVSGGELIDLPYWDKLGRVAATREAIEAGSRVIYEASFLADGVFVSVDILHRGAHAKGWTLSEVKPQELTRETRCRPFRANHTNVRREFNPRRPRFATGPTTRVRWSSLLSTSTFPWPRASAGSPRKPYQTSLPR
jgi:hypothetical protein